MYPSDGPVPDPDAKPLVEVSSVEVSAAPSTRGSECPETEYAKCPEYRTLEYMAIKGCTPVYKKGECCAKRFNCIRKLAGEGWLASNV